jgi:ATP-dependent Clp protease ATP-binding subunit ClpB
MDIEKFTERARGFIQSAQSLALREGNPQFTPEHLLKVLIDDEEGLAARLINAAGGNDKAVRTGVETALKKLPKVSGGNGQVYLAQETVRLLDAAEAAAKKAGDSFVTAEYLLLALALAAGSEAAKILKDAGAAPQALNTAPRRRMPMTR